ncbi:MAG: aminoacyl-tRNA hydrolase [Candidatus Peribacteraceae bacterium]|nr:aminoacyl-tRNA hydrolase [Candidatus Peribacteraceae bacterium]
MKPQFLLFGLGNPGKQYEQTRHNAGFMAVDHAAKELEAGEWNDSQKFMAMTAEAMIEGKHCLLVKPTTFMNRSGECIRKLAEFYKLNVSKQIIVCCDDVDITLGTHRLRLTGGPGTHNGLKSIVDIFGENFPRLRIGIGPQPKEMDLAAWVLSVMTLEERKGIEPAFAAVVEATKELIAATPKIL